MSLIILPGQKRPNEDWAYENGKEALWWDENPVTHHVVLTSPMSPGRHGFNRHKTTNPREMERILLRTRPQFFDPEIAFGGLQGVGEGIYSRGAEADG